MRKYQVLYADPPWKHLGRYRSKTRKRDTAHYPRMTKDEICALNITKYVAKDALLFLWATDGRMDKAIEVMKAWGFKYTTVAFVWLKQEARSKRIVKVVSPWFIKSAELCLFGTRGHPLKLLKTRNTRQLLVAPRSIHSAKPTLARLRIEKMFPQCKKLELFARDYSPGWSVWGNEVKSDIRLGH